MRNIVALCCAAFVTVLGCGSIDGVNGATGSQGAAGSSGANGSDGLPGNSGLQGDKGEVGDQGHIGDMICGETLISAEEWHSVCGSNVGSCKQGQVQCRLKEVEGELIPYRTCFGEVKPAENSGKCWLDTDCDGVKDNTTGAGDNVTLVRQSVQVECFVSGSSWSCDRTLVGGLCRNAKKHCLGPDSQDTCRTDENGEGVLWSDFVADPKEGSMGYECVDGSDVRTWECVVENGVAVIRCSGPKGL